MNDELVIVVSFLHFTGFLEEILDCTLIQVWHLVFHTFEQDLRFVVGEEIVYNFDARHALPVANVAESKLDDGSKNQNWQHHEVRYGIVLKFKRIKARNEPLIL